MTELTIKQKKEYAAMLFLKEELTQAEIAERVGVSRQTINKWAKAEKWEERKVGLTLTREYQIENLYRQVAEINNTIRNRPEGERFADSKEADVIKKLSASIREMEGDVGIADLISVAQRFIAWLRPVDLDKTKEYTRLFDAFVKDNLRKI